MRLEAVSGTNSYVSYTYQSQMNHASPSEVSRESGHHDEVENSFKTHKQLKQVVMSKLIIQLDHVNPAMINPSDCTYKDFAELLSTLSGHARYEDNNFSMPLEFKMYEKDEQKRDYLKMLANLRTEQAFRGNIVGELQIDGMYAALCDARDEAQDTIQYMDGNRVFHAASIVRNAPYFDSFSILEGGVESTYYLQYSNDSTEKNPIMEVFQYDQNNNAYGHVRINVKNVNPRNATLQEMFALYSHNELQRVVSEHTNWNDPPLIDWGQSDFHRGYVNELFRVSSSTEFQEQKVDWIALQTQNRYANSELSGVVLDMLKELHDRYLDHMQRIRMSEKEMETMVERLFRDAS